MSTTSLLPTIGVVAAGAMGSAVSRKLTSAGCKVLTNLDGRSEATRRRAHDAGMQDVSLLDMARRADWVLSILPPSDAFTFAETFLADANRACAHGCRPLVFVDCNAVNPQTVKRIAGLFGGSEVKFVDAGIIGGPPSEGYDPTFYASADVKDVGVLDEFTGLSKYGLKITPLKGEGAGVGDASALKMSYAVCMFHVTSIGFVS
jgi:3-hydroxyisobutyrate dehydrogenase-like beta-hydroxyacid dehydrogenase